MTCYLRAGAGHYLQGPELARWHYSKHVVESEDTSVVFVVMVAVRLLVESCS